MLVNVVRSMEKVHGQTWEKKNLDLQSHLIPAASLTCKDLSEWQTVLSLVEQRVCKELRLVYCLYSCYRCLATLLCSAFSFFHPLSPQAAVVFVGFDWTGCCKASEGRTVAQVSLLELLPF